MHIMHNDVEENLQSFLAVAFPPGGIKEMWLQVNLLMWMVLVNYWSPSRRS